MEREHDSATASAIPQEWERASRHPRFPDGNLGAFELEQGVCIYDRDDPGRYIVGEAYEVGEHR